MLAFDLIIKKLSGGIPPMDDDNNQPLLWYWHTEAASKAAEDILCQLNQKGVRVTEWSGNPDPMPGAVIVDEVTPAVCELVHFASCGGRHLILTVVDSPHGKAAGIDRLLDNGAKDVLIWKNSDECLVEAIIARVQRFEEVRRMVSIEQAAGFCLGSGSRWIQFMMEVVESTAFSDLPVLFSGESGTGKEGLARMVHHLDCRKCKRNLVIVDCTTLSKELTGSELFGHIKGAYTGAHADREGAFSLADEGTLFLDEIGELSLTLQAELLRVLQERSFKPVGSNLWQKTRFRLISATNRDLLSEVNNGRFRSDLYYRILGGCHFHLPTLNERRDDLIQLAEYFLREFQFPKPTPAISAEVVDYLLQRVYPGNIRELKSLIGRMLARYCGAGPLTLGLIPLSDRTRTNSNKEFWREAQFEQAITLAVQAGASLKEIGKQAEELAIQHVVQIEAGNLQRAANRLQVTDRALQLRVAARRNEWRPKISDRHAPTVEPSGSSPSSLDSRFGFRITELAFSLACLRCQTQPIVGRDGLKYLR